MNFQNKFKLSALAIAIALPITANATNITDTSVSQGAGYSDVNISASNDVNVVLNTDNGSIGTFNVIRNGVNLIAANNAGTVINTNLNVNGTLTANTLAVNTLQHNAVEVNADVVNTNVVDLGSNSSNVFTPGSPNTAQLPVAWRLAEDGTTYFYEIADGLGNNAANDSNLPSTYILSGTNLQLFTDTTNSTFVNGGTASNVRVGTTDVTSVTKELDNENLTYAESLKTTNAIQADFAVTDATGSTNANPGVYVDQGRTYDLTNKSIDTGIIGTVGSNNIYGVDLKTEQGKYLASDDSLITGSVNQATLTSDALVIKTTVDDLTKTTEITADGITTSLITGNGANGALVLHGGTNSTTQTLDDNGVKFVTTDALGNVTGTTAIDANGNLTVKGVNVTDAIATNTSNIAALDTRVTTNETNIATNTANIAALDTRVTTNETNIATNTANIATNAANIATNTADIATNKADIATNAANIATNTADIATNAANIATSTADIATNKADIATNKADIAINAAAISSEAATRLAADNAATTDRTAIRTEFAAADTTLQNNINAEAATRLAADNAATTDRTAIRTEFAAADTALNIRVDTEAATRAAADTALNTRVDTETATREAADTALNTRVDTEAATRAAGLAAAATDRQAIRSEFANADAATLASANSYTNSRVSQLNSRVDDVEKTSYRGIAIALAAQQQIPNIGAGQFAVFGGVGHYEGESAGALGVASVFADGRTSVSAALGFAGGNEVGGRVGVSYVFGGK